MTYISKKNISKTDMGLSAAQLNAERTSNTIHAAGYNQLALFVKYTYNAATRVDVNIDVSNDNGTTWYAMQEEDTSSPPVVTLAPRDYQQAISAASENWVINTPFTGDSIRVKISSTGGNTSDLADVSAILSVQA